MLYAKPLSRYTTLIVGPLRHIAIVLALLVPTAASAQSLTITSPTDAERITDTTPLFTGTADPSSNIELRIYTATGPLIAASITSDAGGNWSHQQVLPLNEGPAQVEVFYPAATGDAIVDFTVVGPAPTVQSVTLNGSPGPTATSVSYTVTFSESVTGVDRSDFAFLGTGSAGGFVAFVSGSGAVYTVTVEQIRGEGTVRILVLSGNTGIVDTVDNPLAGGFNTGDVHTVDRVAPARPVITSPTSSVFPNGNIVFAGTVEPGANVAILVDGSPFILVPVDASGAWTYTPDSPLLEGSHFIQAEARDDAGNASPRATVSFAVDTIAPPAPVVTSPSNGGSATATPTITGTAEANADVLVSIDGSLAGTTTAQSNGSWSFPVPFPLAQGSHTTRAAARDAAGNRSIDSNTVTFLVDAAAPTVTSVLAPPGTYITGSGLTYTVNFNEAVTVTGSPRLGLTIGSDAVFADYVSGSGTSALTFRHTVQIGENDADGVQLGTLDLNGGVIRDAVGNNANLTLNGVAAAGVLVDTVGAEVSAIRVPSDGNYTAGMRLEFAVVFDGLVSSSNIRLELQIGSSTVLVNQTTSLLDLNNQRTTLIYLYVVQPGDQDLDGISLVSIDTGGVAVFDELGNPIDPTLRNAPSTAGILIDAVGPTVALSAPTGLQTSAFPLTITFSEPVTGFDAGDVTAQNATVGTVTGGPTVYQAQITPTGADVTLSLASGVAVDSFGNGNAASAPLVVTTASAETEFEESADLIREIIVDQAARDLRARIAVAENLVKAAQDRLTADTPAVDRALSFQGTLQADGLTVASKGSFGAETGLANGSRRILWGEFSVNRDAEGTTSARLDTTLAWERRLSDKALAAWFLGLEVGHADIDRDFTGPLQTLGLSLGAYGVKQLNDTLFLRGFASVTAGQNDLELSNGILSLQSDYRTRSLQAGATLAGVLPMDGWELRPALSLAFGRTWLGTLDLTGTAFGGTGEFQLDAGEVTLSTLTFQPEFVLPLDGLPVADALSLVSVAPGLTCESVSGVEDWSECGVALGLGLQHQSDNGLVRYNADLDLTRVGPRKDTALSLSMEHRF